MFRCNCLTLIGSARILVLRFAPARRFPRWTGARQRRVEAPITALGLRGGTTGAKEPGRGTARPGRSRESRRSWCCGRRRGGSTGGAGLLRCVRPAPSPKWSEVLVCARSFKLSSSYSSHNFMIAFKWSTLPLDCFDPLTYVRLRCR